MKSFIFSILLLFTITLPAFQQNNWSLEQCITYAFQNNLQLKVQELNIQYYKNTLTQSELDVLPTINGSGSYSISTGRALDQTTYQYTNDETVKSFNTSLYSSITLFDGFQKINTIRQNKLNVLATTAEVEKYRNDAALNLALAYLQLLLDRELSDNGRHQLEISKMQFEHTKQLYEAGSVAQGKYLEVQAQVANEELTLVNAQNSVDIALLNLKQMLDLDTMKNFDIQKPDFTNLPITDITSSVDDIYKDAEGKLPQIRKAAYDLESSEKGLNIARGLRSPGLSLAYSYGTAYSDSRKKITGIDTNTGSYIYQNYPFKDQMKDNISGTVTLSASIPIFNGWATNTAISNAKINVQNYQYLLEIAKKNLYKEIQQAQTDAIAAFKKYNASENAVKSMEESFRSIAQKFDLGLVNFVDYSSSKNQLAEAQSNLLQAKYNYIFKSKVLEFYRSGTVKL